MQTSLPTLFRRPLSVLTVAACAAVMSVAAAASPHPPRPILSQAPLQGSFKLDLTGPRPMTAVRISGQDTVTAMFDTGFSGVVIDRRYAEKIGLPNLGPAGAAGITGRAQGAYHTRISTLSLGDLTLREVPAVVSDLPPTGNGRVAVLGVNLFGDALTSVNLNSGFVRVVPRAKARIPVHEATPYVYGGTYPGLPVQFPAGEWEVVLFDTGAPSGINLPRARAEALPLAGPLQPGGVLRGFDGGQSTLYNGRIAGPVKVGPRTIENLNVSFTEGLSLVIAGMDVLRDLVLVVDPVTKRNWICEAAKAEACRIEG